MAAIGEALRALPMRIEVIKNRILAHFPQSVRDRLWLTRQWMQRVLSGEAFKRRKPDRHSALKMERFGSFEIVFRRETADEEIMNHSFEKDIFFPAVPEYHPQPGDIIVDVGAHIGTFSLLAAQRVAPGSVHAIEASLDSFHFLRLNVALNDYPNIRPHHFAIAATDGVATLSHDNGNWGHSTVANLSKSEESVPAKSLKSFLDSAGIDNCQFMKFNCEGAEFPALLAASNETLRKVERYLVFYHCDLWKENTESDLVAHFQQAGFTCSILNKKTKRGWLVAMRNSLNTLA